MESTQTLHAETRSASPAPRASPTSLVPLPIPNGDVLRILGPEPGEAALAVRPVVRFDEPLGPIQSFLGGACSPQGELLRPIEIFLIDAEAYSDRGAIPASALVERLNALPDVYDRLAAAGADELLRGLASPTRLGPLLYCRKRHMVFVARSPGTLQPLTGVPAQEGEPSAAGATAGAAAGAAGDGLHPALLAWDGPGAEGHEVRIYGGLGGTCALGRVEPLEQLVRDQGSVAVRARELAESDPASFVELERAHACCTRDDRELARLSAGGYDFVLERLALISAGQSTVLPLPLGEFSLIEAARMIGRDRPTRIVAEGDRPSNAFESWRRARALRIEQHGPMFLLAGETGGRELLEICRLKLGLIEQAFTQLAAAWSATALPHLCWNESTVRASWSPPAALSASAWGLRASLRKIGLHPASDRRNRADEAVPYPPVHARPALLPPEVVEAMRYFGRTGRATLYVKSAAPAPDGSTAVKVLLEESGIPLRLLCTPDLLLVDGRNWQARLAPLAEFDPDDGAGLPFAGSVVGDVSGLKPREQFEGCACVWYPRCGEAVDLHALGMLLFESLLAHDERGPQRLAESVLAERADLQKALAPVEPSQRNPAALAWIKARCESDSPGALWSRRNLLYRREDRAAARLDAFPPLLWEAVITFGLRMVTATPGFGFCPDRAHDAPRTPDGAVMPLIELRGLLALFDDLIFGRKDALLRTRSAIDKADG